MQLIESTSRLLSWCIVVHTISLRHTCPQRFIVLRMWNLDIDSGHRLTPICFWYRSPGWLPSAITRFRLPDREHGTTYRTQYAQHRRCRHSNGSLNCFIFSSLYRTLVTVRYPQPFSLHPNPDLSSLTVTDLRVGIAALVDSSPLTRTLTFLSYHTVDLAVFFNLGHFKNLFYITFTLYITLCRSDLRTGLHIHVVDMLRTRLCIG